MKRQRAAIIGTGSYLPARAVSNGELAQMFDTTVDWIVERTAIRSRHIAAEGETTSDLATIAARQALEAAEIEPAAIGLIILATTTPDRTFPATGLVTVLCRSLESLKLVQGDRRDDQAYRRVQTGGGAYCADQWVAA